MVEGMSFSVAACLYLVAIVSAFVQRGLRPWSVWVFAAALTVDASATVFVCIVRTGWSLWPTTFHGQMGYAALAIMAVHFVWALSSIRSRGLAKELFHYGSPLAAVIWGIAFYSGIPR